MYLEFSEYQSMGGTLDNTTFNTMEYKAGTIVNLYTYNRLRGETYISDNVKYCVFDLIKLIQAKESTLPDFDENGNIISKGGIISSQSNDGVSVSYSAPSSLSASELASSFKTEVKNLISTYLNDEKNSKGEHLLYKGVYQ